ncbi:MAG: pilus assembly protein PilM [Deltaproteobacteria bacterium]
MAMRIWAIDLGAHAVKLCAIQSSFRGFEIEALESVRVEAVPEGGAPWQAQRAALAALLAAPHPRPDATVVALPGSAVASHLLTLPFSDMRRVEQTLAFEVEGLIPYDLSDVVYDFQQVGQLEGKTPLLVAVARKPGVRELLSMLSGLGLDPRSVMFAPTALQPLLPPDPGPLEAILDVGHERCGLALLESGSLVLARASDGGGRSCTRAIERDLGVSFAEAEQMKLERGTLLEDGDPALVVPIARSLQPMLRDIRQSLKLVASRPHRGVLGRLWLTGGGSRLRGMDSLLARELGCEVRPLPGPRLPTQTPPDGIAAPEMSLCLGLALSAHAGSRGPRINFRRGDQSFQGDFAKLRGKLGKLAALAAMLLAMAGVRSYAQIYVLGQREARIDDAVCKSTQKAIGRCIRDVNVAKSALLGGGAAQTTIPKLSALDLLSETASHLQVEGAKITELDVGVDQARMRGEADSFEAVDKVVAALHAYPCFQEIQRGRVQRMRDGAKIEFNLEARNGCLASSGTGGSTGGER